MKLADSSFMLTALAEVFKCVYSGVTLREAA